MQISKEKLRKIYDRTDGKCHICHKKLSFCNYGKISGRAPWEIEHSNPKSKGGTDHLNNLYAACPSCNRSKGNSSTKHARNQHGNTRAPLSKENKNKIRRKNTFMGGAAGAALSLVVSASPIGILLFTAGGSLFGNNIDISD